MRRALIVLTLSVLGAAGLVLWAREPVNDPLGRSCGGGIFSATTLNPDDDSFMDGCDYVRQTRARDIQAWAVPTGAALLASLGCVVFLATERRRVVVCPCGPITGIAAATVPGTSCGAGCVLGE